ncbi:MAG: SRPBCC family protein [Ornithinimicrobium sp.]
MELVHSFTVPAAPDRTWALLTDLHQVGSCFPGATVTEASDENFSGTVKVKLGPIAMVYSGSGQFVSRDDAEHRAVIEARGKDKRGNGTAGASVKVAVSPDGSGTRVDVSTDLAITGKPAQFGRGVMQDVSDKLLGQFVQCIEGHLGEAEAPTPDEDEVSPSVGADAAGTAADPPGPVAHESPTSGSQARPEQRDDAIDLGSAVGPALISRYGIPLAALGGVVLGYLWGRAGSGSNEG